jgi:hypothetical protein
MTSIVHTAVDMISHNCDCSKNDSSPASTSAHLNPYGQVTLATVGTELAQRGTHLRAPFASGRAHKYRNISTIPTVSKSNRHNICAYAYTSACMLLLTCFLHTHTHTPHCALLSITKLLSSRCVFINFLQRTPFITESQDRFLA